MRQEERCSSSGERSEKYGDCARSPTPNSSHLLHFVLAERSSLAACAQREVTELPFNREKRSQASVLDLHLFGLRVRGLYVQRVPLGSSKYFRLRVFDILKQ